MLHTVISIVKQAAKIMTGGTFTVTEKSAANFVTDKDIEVEKFLLSALRDAFPSIGFLGEEGDETADALAAEYTAVVDPIDGTMNFTRELPLSVISVAILHFGKPYIGVVLNPFTSELFYAEIGKGAFLNGEPIHVSNRRLDQCCFFTAWSTYKKEYAKACFDISQAVYYDTCDIRRLGVCAYELCCLAAGRGELYFEIRLFPWDFAAAQLIVTEAGGFIGTIDFDAPVYTRPQPIIAANSKEHYDYLAGKVSEFIPHIPYED